MLCSDSDTRHLEQSMTDTNMELISTISEDNTLELALREIDIPQPGENDVIIRIEAAPINPSDLGVMFSVADMTTAKQSGSAERPVIKAEVPAKFMGAVTKRVGKAIPTCKAVWNWRRVPHPSRPLPASSTR